MSVGKYLDDTYSFAKNFILTFYYSVIYPKTFFSSDKYNEIKVKAKLYLYLSLFIYLVYLTTQETLYYSIGNFKKALDSLDNYFFGGNILEKLVYTIPVFLLFLFLVKVLIKLIKPGQFIDYNFLAVIILSNTLNFNSLFGFIYLLKKYFIENNETRMLSHIIIILGFILAIASIFYSFFSLKKEKRFNRKSFPLFILGISSLHIAMFAYSTEYVLLKNQEDNRDLKIYSFDGKGEGGWSINFASTTVDSCKFYIDLILKNDAAIDMIWNTKNKSFSNFYNESFESENQYSGIEELFSFDSFSCDAPTSGNYLILKSKSSTIIRFFSNKYFDDSLVSKLVKNRDQLSKTVYVTPNLNIKKINGEDVYYYEFMNIRVNIEESLTNLNEIQRSIYKHYKEGTKAIN